jgi:two-component system response regulator YesN
LKPKLEAKQLIQVLRTTAERIPSLQASESSLGTGPSLVQRIERLLAGYELQDELERLRNVFPHELYLMFAINGRRLHQPGIHSGRRLTLLLEEGLRTIEQKCSYVSCLLDEGRLQVYFVNVDGSAVRTVREIAESATDSGGAGEEGALLLCEPFERLEDASSVYKDRLLRLVRAAFYVPDRRLLTEAVLSSPPARPEPFSLNKFTETLQRWQYEEAFEEFRQYVGALSLSYCTDVFEYKSILSNMIFNITVLLGNMGVDVQALEQAKYRYFNAINEAPDAQDAANRLYAFLEESADCIEKARPAQHPSNVNMKRLLAYIEENYAEPLSLKELARHFHFNPSYLSTYFTSHHKEGFVEVLNRIRTEKAAELLRHHHATISEISGLVGYSDHSYFCKVFKRIMGCSPSQYRREHAT